MSGFFIREGWLYYYNPDSRQAEELICQEIEIDEVIKNIISKEMFIVVKGIIDGHRFQRKFPRSVLTRQKIIEALLPYGFQISEYHVPYLIQYLFQTEQAAQSSYQHNQLGWFFSREKMIFFAERAVGSKADTTYAGKEILKPSGSDEVWLKMLKEEVIGCYPLELILSIGFSAMIVGILHEFIGYTNLLFLLKNETSVGKTTSLSLMASIYGNPQIGSSGLISTFNGTTNAILNSICNRTGWLYLLDEAVLDGGKTNWTEFVYLLEAGVEKARLNKEGALKDQRHWATTIVMTAEESILDQTTGRGGLSVRLFELSEVFTKSAEHANRISACIRENYGHGVAPFAEHLINLGKDNIIALYDERIAVLLSRLTNKQQTSERIVQKLAVVSVSACIIREVFDLDIDLDVLDEHLLKIHDQVSTKQSVAEDAFEHIKQCVLERKGMFVQEYSIGKRKRETDAMEVTPKQIFGKIFFNQQGDVSEIWLQTKKMNEFLISGGFKQVEKVKKELQAAGFLINAEQGRLACKKTIFGLRPRVYVLKMPNDASDSKKPTEQEEMLNSYFDE